MAGSWSPALEKGTKVKCATLGLRVQSEGMKSESDKSSLRDHSVGSGAVDNGNDLDSNFSWMKGSSALPILRYQKTGSILHSAAGCEPDSPSNNKFHDTGIPHSGPASHQQCLLRSSSSVSMREWKYQMQELFYTPGPFICAWVISRVEI